MARQPWADTNAIAWVGFSLGANQILNVALPIPRSAPVSGAATSKPLLTTDSTAPPPQLLILISGTGLPPVTLAQSPEPKAPCLPVPLLLIHGDQDEIFPVADTQRLVDDWHTNRQPVTLRILPGLPHNLDPERAVIFRAIGEYCLTHLAGPNPWPPYHSIAQWEAEAPALIWFWLPALVWIGVRITKVGQVGVNEEGRMKNEETGRQGSGGRSQESEGAKTELLQTTCHAEIIASEVPLRSSSIPDGSPGSFFRPNRGARLHATFFVRLLAFVLATCAIAETAVHLVPPHLAINDGGTPGQGTGPTIQVAEEAIPPGQGNRPAIHATPPGQGTRPTCSLFHIRVNTLGLARRFSVQPKERADFEWLAAQPIWSGVKLQTLLDHVELAVYNRELINWTLDETNYRDFVLNPVIRKANEEGRMKNEETGDGEESGKRESGKAETETLESEVRRQESEWVKLDWRRPLWEEFYPRIRQESSAADAVPIVVRHLRERVTIARLPGLPHEVPEIWRRQITDETGFATIYVAALRSVGVPARLAGADRVEFWDGTRWQPAPASSVTVW